MEKQKLTVVVERTPDGGFDCYIEDADKDFGATGMGLTSAEAIANFREACALMREECARDGHPVPDYEYEYRYDLRSFFDYFRVFNVKAVAERAGINYSQLSQYLQGRRNASRKQYDKLAGCLRELTRELEAATF